MPFLRNKRLVIPSGTQPTNPPCPQLFRLQKGDRKGQTEVIQSFTRSFFLPTMPWKNAYLLSSTFCNLLAVDNVGLLFSGLRDTIFLISPCCFHYLTYCSLVFTAGLLSRLPVFYNLHSVFSYAPREQENELQKQWMLLLTMTVHRNSTSVCSV